MKNLEKKPYISLFEMSNVRKFDNKWFVVRSSSVTPVPGSRQEHLPPHIELIKNNKVILKVNIPKKIPSTIDEIVTKPEITNKMKRNLIKWFNKFEYDVIVDKKLSSYELAIRYWNKDNAKYKIEFTVDKDGNVIIMKFPGK